MLHNLKYFLEWVKYVWAGKKRLNNKVMVDILQILLHVELKDWSIGVRQYQETARKHAGCTITYSTLAVWILWLLDRSPASRHPSLTNPLLSKYNPEGAEEKKQSRRRLKGF